MEEMKNSQRAEGQYTTAKISVWWDIENCQVSKGSDVNSIAKNVHSSLVNIGYCGPISVSAYGDINRIPFPVQQALNSTGISINHVPGDVKDASDKKILVDMFSWALDNAAPANYLLISGDRDFSNALHQLRNRKYNILLAKPQMASTSLVTAATTVWLWTSLLAGGPPQLKSDISHSVHNSVSSSSNSKVSEVTSVFKPMDKSPSKGRESEFINKGKQIHKKGNQVSKTSVTPTVQEDQRNAKQNKDPRVSSSSYESQPRLVPKAFFTPTVQEDQRNAKQNNAPQVGAALAAAQTDGELRRRNKTTIQEDKRNAKQNKDPQAGGALAAAQTTGKVRRRKKNTVQEDKRNAKQNKDPQAGAAIAAAKTAGELRRQKKPTVQEDQRNAKQNKDPQAGAAIAAAKTAAELGRRKKPTVQEDQRNAKQNLDPQAGAAIAAAKTAGELKRQKKTTVQEDQRNAKQNQDPQAGAAIAAGKTAGELKRQKKTTVQEDQRNAKQNKEPQAGVALAATKTVGELRRRPRIRRLKKPTVHIRGMQNKTKTHGQGHP